MCLTRNKILGLVFFCFCLGESFSATKEEPDHWEIQTVPLDDFGKKGIIRDNPRLMGFLTQDGLKAFMEKEFFPPDKFVVRAQNNVSTGRNGWSWCSVFVKRKTEKAPDPYAGEEDQHFIIKPFKNEIFALDEIKGLQAVHRDREVMRTQNLHDDSMPKLAFAEKFYKYEFNGKSFYFELLHAAKGLPLEALIKNFKSSKPGTNAATKSKTDLLKAYGLLGRTLANFHLKLMTEDRCGLWVPEKSCTECKTVINQDAHSNNVFVNLKKGKIIFIDFERMSRSLKDKESPMIDVGHIILDLFFQQIPKEDYKILRDKFLRSYFTQYIKQVPYPEKILEFWKENGLAFKDSRVHLPEPEIDDINLYVTNFLSKGLKMRSIRSAPRV